MARAAGKATKKRGARRKPKKRSNKGRPRRAKFDIATLAAKLGVRKRTVVVARSALTDPAGTDALRRGLPALDPALLPELVLLQHAAIQHFHLRPPACPSKRELIDFFMRVRLSNGSQLRRHMASALATCVRPLSAMAGGRPRKTPQSSNDE